MDFVYFLGRFHVLALHLPIGILIAVVVLEALARLDRYRHLERAAPFLWGLAAVTAIGTAVLGYMHFLEGGFDGPAAYRHRLFGITVVIATTLVWLVRARITALNRNVQTASGVIVLVLVSITGHYGGNLTHGDTYLVEYAPGPLRTLAGLPPAKRKVTDLAMANPYLDIVQPIFAARCSGCHNEDKRRGGLSLASFTALERGGKNGPVMTPGNAAGSDLFRRISLPKEDKDAMPAEGKTPLTPDQMEIIRWWIQSGARADTTLAQLKLTPEVSTLVARALGLGGAEGAAVARKSVPGEIKADPQLVDALVQAGFIVRQRSRSDPLLVVSAVVLSRIGAAQWKALALAQSQIAELNLAHTGIDDRQIQAVLTLKALTRLNLSANMISDAGVRQLKQLQTLQYLNLFGNRSVTDAGLAALADLPALRRLYLWDTQVTPAQARKLQDTRAELVVDLGDAH